MPSVSFTHCFAAHRATTCIFSCSILTAKPSRKVIVTRTESDRTADGIRLDGERNPIGRRTQSDWTADANGEKSLGCVSLEMSVEPKINPEVHFYWASGRIFMLFAVLPDSNN